MSQVNAVNLETVGTAGTLYRVATAVAIRTNNAAWVNFNGTGVVSIRKSWNVTSITDNGTGDYTVNITNNIGNSNYGVLVYSGGTSSAYNRRTYEELSARSGTSNRILTAALTPGSVQDHAHISWVATVAGY